MEWTSIASVISLHRSKNWQVQLESYLPCTTTSFIMALFRSFFWLSFFSLLLLVRKIRPDIVHAHWIIPQGFIAVFAQMMFGVPVVATAHGADIFGLQGSLFAAMKRFSLKRLRAVTVVSRALAVTLADLIASDTKPQIISMGVDSTAFSPVRTNNLMRERYAIIGPFLLYVGRLTEKKVFVILLMLSRWFLKNFLVRNYSLSAVVS